ncbi:MAG: hypothetical protein PHH09_07560 [Methanoregulaceae archaeon]|jgi:hypothetical protein|nr:hypothetical protein [Methanoregulaceae archaeon]MDD5048774.1 hypothetical protein [Methanoregulaceae archaeon]
MNKNIVADSTFFSCCTCDLKRNDILFLFLESYSFHLGKRIFKELPPLLTTDKRFRKTINEQSFDYYQLIKPFFGRDPKHIDDGEYEAIGLGYLLESQGLLHFLVLDDRRPRNFVKNHFPSLKIKMKGTIGLVQSSCCEDNTLSKELALEFLEAIQMSVGKGDKERPCSIDKKNMGAILIPAISYIKNYHAE